MLNSASNAQGSRLSIVVVQVRVMKIYVAAVEALRKNKTGAETQCTIKIENICSSSGGAQEGSGTAFVSTEISNVFPMKERTWSHLSAKCQ
jgi:hypothetical protein